MAIDTGLFGDRDSTIYQDKNQRQVFNGASAKKRRDEQFYDLLWYMLYFHSTAISTKDFDDAIKEAVGELGPEDTELAEQITEFRDYMTDPNHRDRLDFTLKTGDIADKYSARLRFSDEVRNRPDPAFMTALRQAQAYGSRALPSDPAQWGLTEKIVHTLRMAEKYHLNGTMLAMQIRQESGFKNTVGSPAGAMGIAQFIPSTGAKYGLFTAADFYNPSKAIDAMAQHMSDLKAKCGSQEVALALYNAGEGIQKYFDKHLGNNASPVQIISFLNQEREEARDRGTFKRSAWYAETNDYMQRIIGAAQSVSPVTTVATATPAPSMLERAKAGLVGAFGFNATVDNHLKVSGPVVAAKSTDGHSKPDPTLGG
jgi:hypothetical protein